MSLEGVLSKWTNAMQGWQYRYFVLDAHAGLLIYFTSKENQTRDEHRGVVLLRAALLAIDSEDENTFSIRSRGKTFHFQARDADERQKWISHLENAIILNNNDSFFKDTFAFFSTLKKKLSIPKSIDFQRKLTQANSILQSLAKQLKQLELNNQEGECHRTFVQSAKKLIDVLKDSIVSLEIEKRKMDPMPVENESTDASVADENIPNAPTVSADDQACLTNSCSLSDQDNEFFDADDQIDDSFVSPAIDIVEEPEPIVVAIDSSGISFETYEAACEYEPEEELAPIDGNIISHLISQARLSMDLTKITLPTFILERRSFLEMLADFLAHPDEFVNVTHCSTPRDRFIQVVKWYLSAFHAGRKSPVPKKPYNPVLGETFQCLYDVEETPSDSKKFSSNGPVPWASDNQITFLAEQTSHHPPIASFYAECPSRRIQIDGCLWTKSKFLGLSIGVHMIGKATLTVIDHDETYEMTFPSAYGRAILGSPWFEMGGKVSIDCAKTGYSATIEFLTKPFYNGRKHQIIGSLCGPDKREFARIDGEWNGVMNMRTMDGTNEMFFDTRNTAVIKKIVRPIAEQGEYESRRLWKDVTYHLKAKQLDKATQAKTFLEQRQRAEAKERVETSMKWNPKHFVESGEQKWTYRNPLNRRLTE